MDAKELFGRRAAAYWFADGLPELLFGTAMALAGGAAVIGYAIHSKWLVAAGLALQITYWVLICSETFSRAVLERLKRRFTYPRTGYVRPPSQFRPDAPITVFDYESNVSYFIRRIIFPLLVAPNAPYMFTKNPWGTPVGLAATAIWLYLANRDGERPYSLASLLVLPASGIVLALIGAPAIRAGTLAGGVWLAGYGLRTFVRYLKANPKRDCDGSVLAPL